MRRRGPSGPKWDGYAHLHGRRQALRIHWHIENRLHYVRDFTYDEDRCRVHVRHLPRNLACLTNVAIAIVRSNGRFRYLPEANRHYAARAPSRLPMRS